MIPSAPDTPSSPPPSRLRGALGVALRLLVAAGLLSFLLTRVDPDELLARVRAAPWWTWGVPSVLLLVNSVLHALRLRLLAPAPRPPLHAFVRAVLIGNFAGLFLPTGGGDAAKVLTLAGRVGGVEAALGMLAAARLMELLPWALLLFFGAVAVLPGRLDDLVPLAWLAGAAMVGVFAAGTVVFSQPERWLRWLGEGAVGRRVRRLATLRVPPATLLGCLALSVPFALTNCLASWVVLRGYGAPLGYLEVCGLVPTLDVVIALPVTMAGVGVREGMYVHGLAAWGVDAATAMASGSTRWSAEMLRCAIGAGWWLGSGGFGASAPGSRKTVTEGAPRGG